MKKEHKRLLKGLSLMFITAVLLATIFAASINAFASSNTTSLMPQTSANITIEDSLAELNLIDDCFYVEFGGNSILLPELDYYKILDEFGNICYYAADTLQDQSEENVFPALSIYRNWICRPFRTARFRPRTLQSK